MNYQIQKYRKSVLAEISPCSKCGVYSSGGSTQMKKRFTHKVANKRVQLYTIDDSDKDSPSPPSHSSVVIACGVYVYYIVLNAKVEKCTNGIRSPSAVRDSTTGGGSAWKEQDKKGFMLLSNFCDKFHSTTVESRYVSVMKELFVPHNPPPLLTRVFSSSSCFFYPFWPVDDATCLRNESFHIACWAMWECSCTASHITEECLISFRMHCGWLNIGKRRKTKQLTRG